MFLAASLIPLGGIAVTAIDNLEVFRQIEINKIRAAQEETLGNIAQNFSAYLTSCSATLLRQSDSPGNGTESPKTQAMKERILKIFPDARITLFNAAGERLFYHGSLQSEGRKILMKSIARKTVERYAPQRTKEHKYNGNPFADQIVGKDDMGFGTVLSHPNTLQMLKTGNSEQLLFYRTLTTKQSKGALIMIELSTYQSVRRYLESIKNKRFAVEQTFLTLSAFYQDGYRWVIPPLKAKEQVILKLAENTWVSNQPQFLLDAKTLQGFALAIKPALLSGICLIAISSDEHLKASLKSMQTRIWIGVFVALVLLSSVALWISSQLISPLKFLGMGVKALSERKFEARLPEPQGKDEIAQLFTAFNEMMAESYDMQIAKNVQEGLLPQKYPQIKGYSIHGFLREASELGGDCLDCFMLNETKMFFLIGDITGHGVGSALIMAFARAITFHWSQNSENLSPTHLADQIDVMLRHNNTSRMFMGIICGTLDIESNKLELVVKGHIYPLLIKANNDLSWVGIPAYPLGIGKKSPARSFTLDFESGDKLLCMTDGILETRSEQTTLGFAGIEKWALETKSDDARLWIKNIETLYSKWSQQKQQDDISIFALCNNREGNDETE
jgi:HAMP domain-containing protein